MDENRGSSPALLSASVANGKLSPSSRQSGSLDANLNNSERETNVYNYLKNQQGSTRPGIVKANSYTMLDVESQRKNIKESVEADLEHEQEDPMIGYYHNVSGKSKRMSKSLPELRALKHFPLLASQYNAIDESDEDEDDESIVLHDIPVRTAWAGKSEFIFTGIGLALGLNNIWRFPYFCYKFGGGES